MIKAVIFDLDGVIVDACEMHYEVLNRALKEVCNYSIPRNLHDSQLNGLSTRKKISYLINNNMISSDISNKEIWLLKQKYTKEWINNNISVDWVKIGLFEELYRKGKKTACVTNAIRETAELILRKMGVIDYLDLLVSNDDGYRNKPYPDMYIAAMHYLCVSTNETLIVEDSPHGIKAAQDSGAYVWQVNNSNDVTINGLYRNTDQLNIII